MKIGFIGVGSMGGMLVRSLLRSGAVSPQDVFASNRSKMKLDELPAQFPGIHVAGSAEVAARCDVIFICVGAFEVAAVLTQMDSKLRSEQLLVMTSAAVPLEALQNRVPCRVAKLIPSITQEIGAGIALLIYGSRVSREDRELLEGLLGRISRPVVIPESLARPAIGLTSQGPALIAYLLQSMADQAVRSNEELSAELAYTLVRETAIATMKLVMETNMSYEEIIQRIAVPGGMTELAIEVLSRYVPEAWEAVFRETIAKERRVREALVLSDIANPKINSTAGS